MWRVKSILRFGIADFVVACIYVYITLPIRHLLYGFSENGKINTVLYRDIDLSHQTLYRVSPNEERHAHKIYSADGVFTTIYPDGFSRDGLLELLRDNEKYIRLFCPALICLIVDDDGKLRGYQMKVGKPLVHNFLVKRYFTCHKHLWIEFLEKTKFWYAEPCPSNTILCDGRISIIDLESFRKIEKDSEHVKSARHPHKHISDYHWYTSKVHEIAHR